MAAPLPLKRGWVALILVAAFAAGSIAAQKPSPEPPPPGDKDGEIATPSVDLKKAEADAKLTEQDSANQAKSRKNLTQIALAVHNHCDKNKNQLPAHSADAKGKALLSWRVALLPYMDQATLYKEFNLDESWDSPHNKKLLEKMPGVYRSPRVKLKGKGNTVYQVFKGKDAVFGRDKRLRSLYGLPDGTSNTILAVEATIAVPWTKPEDIAFDRVKALPDFGKAFGKKPLAVLFDGTVRVLDLKKISEATLKNAIDPADGKILGPDWKE
jgi:hypothetical protein